MATEQSLAQKIATMRKQKLSDNQIIQSLQHEGHSAAEILDAFDIADHANTFENRVDPKPVENPMQMQPKSTAPPPFTARPAASAAQSNPNPQMQFQGMPKPPMNSNIPTPEGTKSDEEIEELIEAIIEEKWTALEKDVQKVLDWKDSLEESLSDINARMQTVEKNFDSLHKAIVGKIGDYDKNILEVGTQLKAMENVFSKVLPAFTDNVSELNRITEKLKRS